MDGSRQEMSESRLLEALAKGNNEEAKAILGGNFSLINSPLDEDRQTALHLAAQEGNVELLDFILNGDWHTKANVVVNLDAQSIFFERLIVAIGGFTSLHLAAKNLRENILLLLLTAGANPNLTDGHGRTVLHWASENQKEEIGCLIAQSSRTDVNAKDLFGRTPLHWAAKKGLHLLLVVLIDNKAEIDSQTNGGETALHWAALEGDSKAVEELIKRGASALIRNSQNRTPFDLAPSHLQPRLQDVMNAQSGKGEDDVYAQGQGTAATGGVTLLKPKAKQTKKLKITLKK